MTKILNLIAASAIATTAWVASSAVQAQQEATRSITHIAGGLYRAQNNFHYSVFLVTDEGIIATDPINREFAEWLKAEMAKRFDQPVRYVVYSHSDADHTTGGEVFADTATFVGHAASVPIFEASGHSPAPTVTFEDRMDLTLGGKTVELIFPGPSHTNNLIAMRFPEERALFMVDLVSVKRLPFQTLPHYHIPGAIEALKNIEALDYDILVTAHGPNGVPADVTVEKEYLEALLAQVSAAREEGLSVAQAQARISLPDYADWGFYEAWLPLNVEGMYRILDEAE
ncbi:MAG: MBL fold metallo-hydrolase [Proteobacteria bacterium]|nr:MBL fold metallo-hydrolase [Pseudomonadota bacterium]